MSQNYFYFSKNDSGFSTTTNNKSELKQVIAQVDVSDCKMGPFFIYEISGSEKPNV